MTVPVGFIGLGPTGRPLALRLLGAGYPLRVFDERPEAMASLTAVGAVACAAPAAVARAADRVLMAVESVAAVGPLLEGTEGLLAGGRSGLRVAVLTPLPPAAACVLAERLAAAGIGMCDTPLVGDAASAADLSILAGGRSEDLAVLRPLLECLAGAVFSMGPCGAGSLARACHQIVVANALEGVVEALLLARKSGVEPERVREALRGGFAGTAVLEDQGRRMLEGDFEPGWPVGDLQEGLQEVLGIAHRQGFALPGTALAAQHVNALVGRGAGGSDLAALVGVLEGLNGVALKEAP